MPSPTPIFVHPSGPCMRSSNGSLISGNPTSYPEGFVEYYFETARTFMDLTLTGTIATFTSLKWVVSHAGGAFPAIEDRFLTSQPADLQSESRTAYATRFFWDVAGPVFPRQVQGLLGYNIPTSQLLYGSVCPHSPRYPDGMFAYAASRTFPTRQITLTPTRLRRSIMRHFCRRKRRPLCTAAITKLYLPEMRRGRAQEFVRL